MPDLLLIAPTSVLVTLVAMYLVGRWRRRRGRCPMCARTTLAELVRASTTMEQIETNPNCPGGPWCRCRTPHGRPRPAAPAAPVDTLIGCKRTRAGFPCDEFRQATCQHGCKFPPVNESPRHRGSRGNVR